MDQITLFLKSEIGKAIGYYLITILGAVAMYVFSLYKGFEGTKEFLKRVLPQKSDSFYERLDFVLVVFIGSAIGYIILAPSSTVQALAAGLGWIGAMNTLTGRVEPKSTIRHDPTPDKSHGK